MRENGEQGERDDEGLLEALRSELRAEMKALRREMSRSEDRARWGRRPPERWEGEEDGEEAEFDREAPVASYIRRWEKGRRRDYRKGSGSRPDRVRAETIRRELQSELAALDAYQKRLGHGDPAVRQYVQPLLGELMADAEKYGMRVGDLSRAIGRLGWRDGTLRRLPGVLRTPQGRGFAWGVGAALAGLAIWPSLRQGARPVVREVVKGALNLSEQAQEMVTRAKEEVEDLVAEAQFQRVQDSMEPEAVPGPQEE